MPRECAHFKCRNMQTKLAKQDGISFHTFPKDPMLRQVWTSMMGRRDDWQPKHYDVVCSNHFAERCFDRMGQNVRLRKESIPIDLVQENRPCLENTGLDVAQGSERPRSRSVSGESDGIPETRKLSVTVGACTETCTNRQHQLQVISTLHSYASADGFHTRCRQRLTAALSKNKVNDKISEG